MSRLVAMAFAILGCMVVYLMWKTHTLASKREFKTFRSQHLSDDNKLLLFSDVLQFTGVVIDSIGDKKEILANICLLVKSYLPVNMYFIILENDSFDIVSDIETDLTKEYVTYLENLSAELALNGHIELPLKAVRKYTFLKANGIKSVFATLLKDKDVKGFIVFESKNQEYFKGKEEELDCIAEYVSSVLYNSDNFTKIETVAKKDFLTGLYNRLTLDENATEVFEYARKTSTNVAVAMFDIDHFKGVNDTYGHQSGDLVLQAVSSYLKRIETSNIIPHRYGGEEFLVLFADANPAKVTSLVDNIRKEIESSKFTIIDGDINITISCGVYTTAVIPQNYTDIVELADANLYVAKNTGRNKVVSTTNIE